MNPIKALWGKLKRDNTLGRVLKNSGYLFLSGPDPFPPGNATELEMKEAFEIGFFVFAEPKEEGVTGVRNFFVDTSGVIRSRQGEFPNPPSVQDALLTFKSWPPID